MGFNRRSTSLTHRSSQGVKNGLGNLSQKTHALSGKKGIYRSKVSYLAYRRFGMMNIIGLNVLAMPNSQVSTEHKLQFLIVLDFVFRSQQSATVLNNIKEARKLASQRRSVNMAIMAQYREESTFKRMDMSRRIGEQVDSLSPIQLQPLANYAQKQSFLKRSLKNIGKYAASIALATSILFSSVNSSNAIAQTQQIEYAKSGAKKLFKPVNIALASTLLAGSIYSTNLKAQNPNADTTWATGAILVYNLLTNNSITSKLYLNFTPLDSNSNLPTKIDSMEWTNGEYMFNLPVDIDTTVGINNSQKLSARVISTGSADLNIFLEKNTNDGEIEIYNMLGQEIKREKFSGNEAYISFPEISNGAYIYRIITNNKSTSNKFLKMNSSLDGRLPRPQFDNSNNNNNNNNPANARIATLKQADYILTITDPDTIPGSGYKEKKDTLTFVEGNQNGQLVYLTPRDPLTIDLIVRTWDLNGDTLINSMVYLIDNQSNLDSLRTDSTGEIIFKDLPQGKTYTMGVGGLKGFKNEEGFSISTPTNVHNYNDTIMRKNYTLIPDTTFTGKDNVNTYISDAEFINMFGKFNIQSSLDTTRVYLSNLFTTSEQNDMRRYLDSIYSWTAIPTIESPTPFTNQTNYNPYTTPHNLVGTNIAPGTSNTQWNDYNMTGVPENVRVNASMTVNSSIEREFDKEWNRVQGRGETTIRNSNMNSVPTLLNNKDIAIMIVADAMGKARFKYLKHDLTGQKTIYYLNDNSTVMNKVMPMIKNNNQNSTANNNTPIKQGTNTTKIPAWNYQQIQNAKINYEITR